MSSQEAQEGGSFSAEAPANLNPEYDEPRSSGALELWRRPSDGRRVGLGVRGRSTCAEHKVRGGGGAGAAARGGAPTARQRQGM